MVVARRCLGTLVVAVTTVVFAMVADAASGAPPAVEAKRAEVARIMAEVQDIDHQVEDAAEAYNGARYLLSQATERVTRNRRELTTTTRSLGAKQDVLAKRLRHLYATPEPSLAQILVTSGSLTAAIEQVDLLELVGQGDAGLVQDLRESRERFARLRAELVADRAASRVEVVKAERQTRAVEALLARREAVLSSARGELAGLLAAERARVRREAAAQAEIARRRDVVTPTTGSAPATPSTPAPAADPSEPATPDPPSAAPADPLPRASGNAAAASIAMRYLGVPYVWGGASPAGFDCSGLASYSYAQIGKSVPHYTVAIWNAFPKVPSGQLEVGDLVFYRGLGHMGIYIGGGQYVNAPQTGDVVKVSSMSARSDYVGAVRP